MYKILIKKVARRQLRHSLLAVCVWAARCLQQHDPNGCLCNKADGHVVDETVCLKGLGKPFGIRPAVLSVFLVVISKQRESWRCQSKKLKTTLTWHRFSAFWLRSKCSICSYQLNIWYGGHVPPSILNWFLSGDKDLELAPALSRVGFALQYRKDLAHFPTTNLIIMSPQPAQDWPQLIIWKDWKMPYKENKSCSLFYCLHFVI